MSEHNGTTLPMLQTEVDKFDASIDPKPIMDRIVHILTIYPVISPGMLQTALGFSCPAYVWRPILQQLIQDGRVVISADEHQHPIGRAFKYTKLSLNSK
jgi:hypothetical protein